jgi:HPt (histidine-containing phosphotransfer) domain-containing protein
MWQLEKTVPKKDDPVDETVIAGLRARLMERARAASALLEDPAPPEGTRRADLIAWTHQLGGTAGTIGLSDLGAAALAIEDSLRGDGAAWQQLRARMLELLA